MIPEIIQRVHRLADEGKEKLFEALGHVRDIIPPSEAEFAARRADEEAAAAAALRAEEERLAGIGSEVKAIQQLINQLPETETAALITALKQGYNLVPLGPPVAVGTPPSPATAQVAVDAPPAPV